MSCAILFMNIHSLGMIYIFPYNPSMHIYMYSKVVMTKSYEICKSIIINLTVMELL